nr:hypothetical protein [Tanacetum cinerariifolium]
TTWARFEESMRNCFGPSKYKDSNGALSKLLQLETREFLVSRPTTLGDVFSLALITKAHFDNQAAPVSGTMTKTFGNNGGDESESLGPSLQLLGTLGTGKVHILIDNGRTHNFVQPGVVERMKLPVKNTKPFKVYIESWIFAITEYFSLLNTPANQWLNNRRFEESMRNCFGPSKYEDPNGALSKLLQLDTREFLVSRPATLGDVFLLALITKARFDNQAALVSGTTTKTFGNNGGDESESLGLVTQTKNEKAIKSGDTLILNSLFGHGSPRSLQLLGTGKVHILIDNGSTHNFVQPRVVERMKLPVKNTKPFKVYIESWIFAITEYFSLLNTPANQWQKIVRFEESMRNCFGPSKFEDPNVALSKLLQLETVKDYQHEFEKLMNRATDISDSLLISFYISGLKLHLQREFLISRPTTLGDVFSLALITKAHFDNQVAPVSGTTTKTFGNNGGDESESLGPVTQTENEKAIKSEDTLILNSLFGHGSPRSFQLLGTLGTGKVHILIDNGSTHNFVQSGVGRIYLFLERLNAKYIKKKKMKAGFQRRIWKSDIKIDFKTPP